MTTEVPPHMIADDVTVLGQTLDQGDFKTKRVALLNAVAANYYVQVEQDTVSIDVQAIKTNITEASDKKKALADLIGKMNGSSYAENEIKAVPQSLPNDIKEVKEIILDQYVKQNVIKILTIVYAYIVLLEKVQAATGDTPNLPEPSPPSPSAPGNDGEYDWVEGNNWPPIPGVDGPEDNGDNNYNLITQALETLFNNQGFNPFMTKTQNFIEEYENQSGKPALKAILYATELPNDYTIPVSLNQVLEVYPTVLARNQTALNANLTDGENKDNKVKSLISLLRRMQYYQAKKRALEAKGGPGSVAANDDLLRFVLDTFPLFTKMSTGDVDTIQEKRVAPAGGKLIKKKKH